MQKFISLVVALMCIGAASACMKKSVPSVVGDQPLTVIVMDTTQALLPEAQVKIGEQSFTTSFDGRIVLEPEQIKGVSTIVISCEGYETRKVRPEASPLIVRLTPKRVKESRVSGSGKDRMLTGGRPVRTEALYSYAKTSAVMVEDEAVLAEAADHIVVGYGGVVNQVSAGKLTAGEVNDFTKWYFWPTVLDSTHKAFIQTWGIAPRHRYTVQVKNPAGYPVVNYPVNLTDQQGNTLFQAVTDNTGKAELWNGLRVTGYGVQVNGEWKEGLNTMVVDEPCDAPEEVDVVFVFDATGSMGDELHYLQAEMKDVIARAKDATGGLAIRTGAVVYRDHGDEYLSRISRLTDDISITQSFIDKQQASGGGDFPEAVPEALMAALNSVGWDAEARARIVFLILDAPCHSDSATVALLHEQVFNAAAQGVRIVPVVCSGLDKSGEYLMRAIALATNGTSFFLTDDSGIGHAHLKPTTDSLQVEHLNDMLVRTIVEFSTMPGCEKEEMSELANDGLNEDFIPNPFDANDLQNDPSIPHGPGVHYLLDVSGKLLGIYEGEIEDVRTDGLPRGIYFIKTYSNGQWFTKKIFV